MILAPEQRKAGAVLFGLTLVVWLVMALWPVQDDEAEKKPTKKPWAERRDSIRLADSMRFVQWKADREARYDSFFIADSIRHEQWKVERQAKWDSMRVERQAKWDSMRKADSVWRDSVGMKYFAPRVKKDTVLDLNHCDTAELQLIRGIGRYTAVQIVRYRERLGGFYSPEQLKDEVFGKLSLDTLLYRFTADVEAVQRMDVNKCSIDRMQRHPYIRYEQAKAIYTLRRKKVRLESIEDLRALPELTEEELVRMAPYLSFE